jgi:rfaE bifunctional protein kinase chain/domain
VTPPALTRERLAAGRVLVVGDAMLDRYWFGAGRAHLAGGAGAGGAGQPAKHQERLGGAANVACNVKALGAQSSLITAIGDDEHGHRLEALLEKSGIESLFERDPGLTTIVKLRVIGRSQQLLRVDFEEEPDHEVLERMQPFYEKALAQANVVLFSDYGKGGLAHIPDMIRQARAAGSAGARRSEGQRLGHATAAPPRSRRTAPSSPR